VSAEVVVEDARGDRIRAAVDPLDIEVSLAPGQVVDLDIAPEGDDTIEIGADEAVQAHCEGRFDRA
jgi:hypothetical protein